MAITLTAIAYAEAGACVIKTAVAGVASGATGVEYQIAIRPDFKFCVAPMMVAGTDANQFIAYVTQDTNYYVRARSVFSNGLREVWSNVWGVRTPLVTARNTSPSGVLIQPAMVVVPARIISLYAEGSPASGYPVDNLTKDSPVDWRVFPAANGPPPVYAVQATIAPEPIDTIAILNTSVPENGVVSVQANTVPDFSNPVYSYGDIPFRASPNVPGRPYGHHALIRLPSPVACPYWRVAIKGNMPFSMLIVQHLVFGLARMSKNFSADMTETPIDLGSLSRIRSGNADRVPGFRMRKVAFDLSYMTEAQFETRYRDLGWRVGSTDPVLVVPNSKSGAFLHDRICYGALSASKYVNPSSPRWTASFSVDSIV